MHFNYYQMAEITYKYYVDKTRISKNVAHSRYIFKFKCGIYKNDNNMNKYGKFGNCGMFTIVEWYYGK